MKSVPDTGAMVTCAGLALFNKLNMAQGALGHSNITASKMCRVLLLASTIDWDVGINAP